MARDIHRDVADIINLDHRLGQPTEPAGRTVNLTVIDRVTLLQLLPEYGNLLTLRTKQALEAALNFTEEEQTRMQMRRNGGELLWETTLDVGESVTITERGCVMIDDLLRELEQANRLQSRHLPLWDIFHSES